MCNLIKAFNDNRNTGIGELRVIGPYKVKVFNGCGSNYGVVADLEKDTTIIIDKIAQSENSHSTFGHLNYIVRKDGITEPWSRVNCWISLASNNLVPKSFMRETSSNYSTNDNATKRMTKASNREYACEDFNW